MQPILSNAVWLSLSREERDWLRETFDIPKSGHVEVLDQRVICDGTMVEDLMELTVEKLQEYLNSDETDLYALLDDALETFHNPLESLKKAETNMKEDLSILKEGTDINTPDLSSATSLFTNANPNKNGKKNSKK